MIFWSEIRPSAIFSADTAIGLFSKSCFRTSCALLENLADETSIKAPDCSRMYFNSPAGKLGASGTAMALLPSTESSVTARNKIQHHSTKRTRIASAHPHSRMSFQSRRRYARPVCLFRFCQHLAPTFAWPMPHPEVAMHM